MGYYSRVKLRMSGNKSSQAKLASPSAACCTKSKSVLLKQKRVSGITALVPNIAQTCFITVLQMSCQDNVHSSQLCKPRLALWDAESWLGGKRSSGGSVASSCCIDLWREGLRTSRPVGRRVVLPSSRSFYIVARAHV